MRYLADKVRVKKREVIISKMVAIFVYGMTYGRTCGPTDPYPPVG